MNLKFESKKNFLDILNNFKTDLFNRMNYEELKRCLLSKLKENGKPEEIKLINNEKL